MKKIRVSCDTKLRIPLDELTEIQGDLKEMTKERYEKFRRLVEKKGLWFACHVWKEGSHEKKTVPLCPEPPPGTRSKNVDILVPAERWWIVDGHGRKRMLTKMRSEGYVIPDIPCVEIEAASIKEAKEAVLAASSNFQRATTEGLHAFMHEAGFTMEDLEDIDIPDIDLPKFEEEFFKDPDGVGGLEEGDELYTKKIEAPIYSPKSKTPPKVSALTDMKKTDELLKEISAAKNLPTEVRAFLQVAAARHVVFDYEQIAEYYSHAPKEVQALFEKSALVIIDFQKAIENGFVALSEKLAEAYRG